MLIVMKRMMTAVTTVILGTTKMLMMGMMGALMGMMVIVIVLCWSQPINSDVIKLGSPETLTWVHSPCGEPTDIFSFRANGAAGPAIVLIMTAQQ